MNPVLLDTHVLVWLLTGNARLGSDARERIQGAADAAILYVSAISAWEIAMLVSKQRLVLDKDVGEWLDLALSLPGIKLEGLLPSISVGSTRLPGEIHNDPADRIITATARHLDAVLVTADAALLKYGQTGHVKVMDAEC